MSPKAAALLRAGRDALRPTSADRERVTAALRARLGPGALPLAAGASASLFARSAWAKISALSAAVGLAGGLTYLALQQPTHAPLRGPLHQIDLATEAGTSEPVPSAAQNEPAPALTAAAPAASPATARSKADRLAEEVAILSRATSELHSGRAAGALRALDEHQRKFPRGLLVEERRAARVQALCALGRKSEAKPELERLVKNAPQSPTTRRAKQVCGDGS
jgi:TolA-binding protein